MWFSWYEVFSDLRHSDDEYLTHESQPEYPGIWRVYHQFAHFRGGTGVFLVEQWEIGVKGGLRRVTSIRREMVLTHHFPALSDQDYSLN
jgi:hypothetical protein